MVKYNRNYISNQIELKNKMLQEGNLDEEAKNEIIASINELTEKSTQNDFEIFLSAIDDHILSRLKFSLSYEGKNRPPPPSPTPPSGICRQAFCYNARNRIRRNKCGHRKCRGCQECN